ACQMVATLVLPDPLRLPCLGQLEDGLCKSVRRLRGLLLGRLVGIAQTHLCTELLLDAVAEGAACTNLLQALNHWHVVCAPGGTLRLGDTRVSQGQSGKPRGRRPPFARLVSCVC